MAAPSGALDPACPSLLSEAEGQLPGIQAFHQWQGEMPTGQLEWCCLLLPSHLWQEMTAGRVSSWSRSQAQQSAGIFTSCKMFDMMPMAARRVSPD